jgi:hypothetical protein
MYVGSSSGITKITWNADLRKEKWQQGLRPDGVVE